MEQKLKFTELVLLCSRRRFIKVNPSFYLVFPSLRGISCSYTNEQWVLEKKKLCLVAFEFCYTFSASMPTIAWIKQHLHWNPLIFCIISFEQNAKQIVHNRQSYFFFTDTRFSSTSRRCPPINEFQRLCVVRVSIEYGTIVH